MPDIARADEGLAHAHEQIKRADEQLTRLTEQLARMERDDARPPSARPGPHGPGSHEPGSQEPGAQDWLARTCPQPPPGGRPALRTLVGLSLAACITVAALLVLLLSYGDGPTLIVARWAPQPVSTPSLPPENPPSPAQPAPSTFQVAAAESAPAQATPPQATTLAQAAPQDAAPAAPAALPDQTQLLQTIARDLANLERNIEQLKANQQQIASDNSKAIGELKASQEEMKRALAKVSEQSPPKTSQPRRRRRSRLRPCASPSGRLSGRRRERGLDIRREWIYDDLVAVDSVIIEASGTLQHRPARSDRRRRIAHGDHREEAPAKSHRTVIASHLCRLIPLANFGKRAQPVAADESVRAAYCNS